MKKRLLTAIALLATACILLAGCGSGPNNQAGEIAAAKAYIQSIARQNSLKVDGIKVLSVRENGDEAIVRVEVRYHPYLRINKTQSIKGPEATVTLAVHLHSSRWYPEYGAAQ